MERREWNLVESEHFSLYVCVTLSPVGMVFPNSGCSSHRAVLHIGVGSTVDKDQELPQMIVYLLLDLK
jgi:hypothetical protein